jgi:ABC-type multidrug transport system ATPase subunit/ABC-type transporter Mla maintaining outer membrane lipid asymmetry permease subunit MlaE
MGAHGQDAQESKTLLRVEALGIAAGGNTLFSGAAFHVRAGEMALVVGPSGSGKSVLLRTLCGLAGPDTPGLEIGGTVRLFRAQPGDEGPGRAGIVFQDFALFDDLSMQENLLFGADHSHVPRSRPERRALVQRLAAELDVPLAVPVGHASLGQKQRAALARTLAFDADVVLFDEPTSGLDPHHSRRVADLIRRTARDYGKACVVVSHEHEVLREAADHVLLLDPSQKTLRPVTGEELDRYAASDVAPPAPAAAPRPGWAARATARIADFFEGTARALEETVALPLGMVPLWRAPRWGLGYFLRYFGIVAFPSSLLYIALAGLIAGVVTTYFTFEYFPLRQYTEPVIIDDILSSLGYALYRIIVPVLVSLLVAARCGAAVAADVGNRVWSHQVEALRSFGAEPRRYIYTNILWAFLLGVPVLTAASFAVAYIASLVVYMVMHPDSSPVFWSHHFLSQIRTEGLFLEGTDWLAAKMSASALGTGAVAYARGIRPKPSADSVNAGITSSVIRCTLLVLAVHAAFAFVEFGPAAS